MRDALDLRLVPPACAAWLAAAVVVVLSPQVAFGLAALAGTGCAAAVAFAVRHAHGQPAQDARCGPRPLALQRPRATGRTGTGQVAQVGVVGQLVLVLATVGVVLGTGAVQLVARQEGHVDVLAADRSVVRVVGTVDSDAVPVASAWPGAPPRFRIAVSTQSVEVGGMQRPSAAPVLVLGGSEWSDVVYGSRVAASGRLSAAEPGSRSVAILLAPGSPTVLAAPAPWLAWAEPVRSALADIAATLPGDAGALLPGVAVGDTTAVPADLADAMRGAGLTHLTAVSGAHFALVGAAVLACAGAVRVHRRVRLVLLAGALTGFVVLVHPGASVVRAAAMGALGVVGMLAGRPARALPALGAGVVVLLVADPWLARDVGFVLSVLATSGLVLLAKPLAARWADAVGTPVAYALAVPVAAQCVCAPVVLLLSPTVSTYAVPANLVADLAVAPATVVGLLAALVAPWWPAAAGVLAAVAGAACWWIGAVARTAVSLPGARVAWLAGPPGAALLAAATAAFLVLALRGRTSPGDAGVTPPGRGRGRARQSAMALLVRATRDPIPPHDRPAAGGRPRRGPDVGRRAARAGRARLRRRGPARRPGRRPPHRAGP